MPQDVTIRWGPFQKHLKLTAGQEKILSQTSLQVIITGPPGCGKSVVLMLKGLQWLQAGHDVIVFGIHPLSLPSCRSIYCQLSESYQRSQGPLRAKDRTWGRVLFEHQFLRDACDMMSPLQTLLKHGDRDLHVLIDDLCPDDCEEMVLVFTRRLREFLSELKARVPGVHLWATNLLNDVPEAFDVHLLTEPTRYPIPLLREVSVAVEILKEYDTLSANHGYSEVSAAASRHRPDIIHAHHSGKGEERWPVNSEKCGRQVGSLLKDIGVREYTGTSTGGAYTFRDVFIISRNPVNPLRPPQAFIMGLESSGVPVQILASRTKVLDDLDDVILARANKVTLANHAAVRGLDRSVVVCLTGSAGPEERYELTAQEEQDLAHSLRSPVSLTHTDPSGQVTQTMTFTPNPSKGMQRKARKSEERVLKLKMDFGHRLEIWSRASEQLIVMHLPKGMEGDLSKREDYSNRKCVIL